LGVDAIPKEYLDSIELYDTIVSIADDLLIGYEDSEEWIIKYPAH
jgi:hypothetical protein